MRVLIAAVAAIALAAPSLADDRKIAGSWSTAKNWTSDKVYHDNLHTLYCGCEYTSHGDSDGSGDVSMADCGMTPLSEATNTTGRIE